MESSFDSTGTSKFRFCGVGIKAIHIFFCVLNIVPLGVTVSVWPRIINPLNPFWISAFITCGVVIALFRMLFLLASVDSILRMKRAFLINVYVFFTWLAALLDAIAIVLSLALIEYPEHQTSREFFNAFVDRYAVKHQTPDRSVYFGLFFLCSYLSQMTLELFSIYFARKAVKFIHKKPILVHPGDEGVELYPVVGESFV